MANKIDTDQLLASINIVDVISSYMQIKKHGADYVGLCPFHGDRNPSMHVSEQKQIFKCFSCNVGGNAIKFVSLYDKLSYHDAIIKLCEQYGFEYQKTDENYEAKNKLRNEIKAVNKEAGRFYFNELKHSEIALNYVKSRGLSGETVTKFGIGYAPDSWTKLYDHFMALGTNKEILVEAGLVNKIEDNGKVRYVDKFSNRLMFPIFDYMGNVLGFSGRILEKDAKKAKYVNTRETAFYVKGNHLFGMNFAKQSKANMLLVVEGQMDVIALHQKGIDFAVASLGTALTQSQARLIKNYCKTVILSYDNDSAGKEATQRGMSILKKEGLDVKIFRLTGAKDPDEYLKTHTKEDFLNQLKGAYSMFEYIAILASEDFPTDTNEGKIKFITKMQNEIAKLTVAEKQIYSDWLYEKFGKKYNFTKELILSGKKVQNTEDDNKFQGVPKRIVLEEKDIAKEYTESERKADYNEKTLLYILSKNPNLILKNTSLNDSLFYFEENAVVFRKIAENLAEGNNVNETILYDGSPNDNTFAEIGLKFNIPEGNMEDATGELVQKIKLAGLDISLDKINSALKDPTLSQEERTGLMSRVIEINLKKKKIKSGKN